MNEQMEFPETFEGFAKEYGFKDDKEVYTNGSDLIPIFRVKQWLEYDNKLRRIETDTAYECGKHANKWIPVSERLPNNTDPVNITWVNHDPESYYADIKDKPFAATGHYCNGKWWWYSVTCQDYLDEYGHWDIDAMDDAIEVIAWMPLPAPFEPQESEE